MKNIPRPENSTWTDEQWQAITARGQDILVAAAAGSGKTAVLVERIIKRITDSEEPIDVDRLLIVTFTNAAAAEMKKRIGEALEQELTQQPDSLFLKRQLSLLSRASISTLHSFCLEVLRQYYYMLDLDPKFRIADDTEAILLREEVVEELFEDHYSRESKEAFYHLVDCFSSDRSDKVLQTLVLKLYDFSRSHPAPDEWLEQMALRYGGLEGEVDASFWTEELLAEIKLQLQGALLLIKQALARTREPGGPAPYAENLEQMEGFTEHLLRTSEKSWEELYLLFQELDFGKLKPCKGDAYDKNLQEQVKALREQCKKQLNGIKDSFFLRPLKDYLADILHMAPAMHTLVELIKDFSRRYAKVKHEKALVDFADLEHFCLEALRTGEVALSYRNRFVEVLVDEYQDTNFVQEAIIQLVTKAEPEAGNLFMVGDVKQSIYRFRLAEPGLFLSKYRRFAEENSTGLRIDLARNFRSRAEVLDGTNYIFKQIMNQSVGEIDYDEDAELKVGASYPSSEQMSVELLLIERPNGQDADGNTGSDGEGPADVESDIDRDDQEASEADQEQGSEEINKAELEVVQLEARLMAKKIKELMGQKKENGGQPFLVYDGKQNLLRPIQYRDIVILLRATSAWAPVMLEEFKKQGIPAYAELSSGYFSATEVAVMLSLLKVIDNPYQDIPLASVLRSPVIGLSEEELAQIRMVNMKGSYFEAVREYVAKEELETILTESAIDPELLQKLKTFLQQLNDWRTQARQGSLAELIWKLYRQTGYYDFVGGMPGGNQRQANLRALYDRARQYESTSFRGLFRFLRFIERMQDLGRDLGTARALGEQEDVVRIMTIHKSKGLEFPVVFIAGIAKMFNMQELNQRFLLHKELGFGTKYIDPVKRISYPMLPQLTIRRRMHMEHLAEEMRVLYVALTRAKEKLFLVGSVKDKEKLLEQWLQHVKHEEWVLPDYDRSKARSYLDWVGPAIIRHQQAAALRNEGEESEWKASPSAINKELYEHPSKWSISFVEPISFLTEGPEEQVQHEELEELVQNTQRVKIISEHHEQLERILSWSYSYPLAQEHKAKQSVTELKRQKEWFAEDGTPLLNSSRKKPLVDRPRFLQEKKLTSAERGTAMHMVMQHLPLTKELSSDELHKWIAKLVANQLLTNEQADEIKVDSIMQFLQHDLGQRVREAIQIHREIPFSYGLPATEVFAKWREAVPQNSAQSPTVEEELVLVQGVIDCLLEEEDGLVLVDYKTDAITGRYSSTDEAQRVMRERYSLQLNLYARAIEDIWRKPVKGKYLYLFDGGLVINIQ